jgi:hypothetical protein
VNWSAAGTPSILRRRAAKITGQPQQKGGWMVREAKALLARMP